MWKSIHAVRCTRRTRALDLIKTTSLIFSLDELNVSGGSEPNADALYVHNNNEDIFIQRPIHRFAFMIIIQYDCLRCLAAFISPS